MSSSMKPNAHLLLMGVLLVGGLTVRAQAQFTYRTNNETISLTGG